MKLRITTLFITLSLLLGLALWQQQSIVAAKTAPKLATPNVTSIVLQIDPALDSSGAVQELINALNQANADPDATTIQLVCGTYTLTQRGDPFNYYGFNGLPVITSNVTIEGNGAVIERSSAMGTPTFRLFAVAKQDPTTGALLATPGSLTLDQVTLRGGASGTDNGGGGGAGLGWAVFNDGGALTLINATLSGNAAQGGAGGPGTDVPRNGGPGQGLGVGVGTVTINNATLNNNSVTDGASATVANGGGSLYLLGDGVVVRMGDATSVTFDVTNTILSNTPGGASDAFVNTINAGTATLNDPGNRLGNYQVTNTPGTLKVFNSCGISITPNPLLIPALAQPYAQSLSASPYATYSFSLYADSLPPGLQLVNAYGVYSLQGTPTTPGTFTFTIRAQRSGSSCEAIRTYTVTIPPTVVAKVNCKVLNANGSYTVWFGYENSTGAAVTIPVGANNTFTSGAANRGQTTVFQPGVVNNAFSVTFANAGAFTSWNLRGPDGVLRGVVPSVLTPNCP